MLNKLKTLVREGKSKYRIGFTLAEVLITIVIIGVIATITVPIIYNKYQKEIAVTRLKKVYSELQQAINWSKAENGDISSWNFNLSTYDFFNTYLNKYIILRDENFLESRTSSNIQYYEISGKPETRLAIFKSNYNDYSSTRYLYLMSGAQLIVTNNPVPEDANYTGLGFYVDTNGFSKPNTFGKDVFHFQIFKECGLTFEKKDDNETYDQWKDRTLEQLKNGPSKYSYQCNKQGRGMWCGAVIQASGWKMPKDYPW